MKDPEIYTEWFKFMNDNKYKDYFLDNNNIWLNSLENVKKYINTHNKRPSCMCKDKEIKSLGEWIIHQISNYKNKTKIMKDSIIYNEWTNFINDDIYKEYFLDNNTIWFNNLVKVKKYIDENNKRPSSVSKNKEIKTLGTWINTQQRNYKNNKEIMAKITHLKPFLPIFSAFHFCLSSFICFDLSPSTQYSTLRNTISINMVCGQAQPQNILPKATVNKITKTINVNSPIAKMKKSCGQNILPKNINFRSKTLNRNNGSPSTLIKGKVKNKTK